MSILFSQIKYIVVGIAIDTFHAQRPEWDLKRFRKYRHICHSLCYGCFPKSPPEALTMSINDYIQPLLRHVRTKREKLN